MDKALEHHGRFFPADAETAIVLQPAINPAIITRASIGLSGWVAGRQTRDLRSLAKQSQEELRMRAVKLRRQGQSRTASGGMLEAHRNTIGRWVADHAAGGIKALKIRQRGRKEGAKRRWSAAQEAAVQAMICEKTPDQRKLAFALWTRRAVCERSRARVCHPPAGAHLRRVAGTLGLHPAAARPARR